MEPRRAEEAAPGLMAQARPSQALPLPSATRPPPAAPAHTSAASQTTHISSGKQKRPGAPAAGSVGVLATRASPRAGAPPRRLGAGGEDGREGYTPDAHSAFELPELKGSTRKPEFPLSPIPDPTQVLGGSSAFTKRSPVSSTCALKDSRGWAHKGTALGDNPNTGPRSQCEGQEAL
ncbi:predicted GPI-anchored protein 58 [Lutra lutra]|uniref:predicted GPI-anchored protein 58 n=1 Tax=Lutra lutra TaxID=9657 RepID=UPI001FD23E79|nr:predicted GPI-anchored protein 58 [Lutra lutra]